MKKALLVLAVLFVGLGFAQEPVYRLESKGPGRVLAITDTVNNIPKRYPDINIFADINAVGNVEIFLVEKPKVYVPIQFNGQRGIPYTQFVDGDNADATFASADAVTTWFDENFNTAGGSASPTAPEVVSITSNRNIAVGDIQSTLACTTSATLTVTLDFSSMQVGQTINLEAHEVTLTITGASGVTINGDDAGSVNVGDNSGYIGGLMRKTGANSYVVF